MGSFERRVLNTGFLFQKYWSRWENSEKYAIFLKIIRWYHISNPLLDINYRLPSRCEATINSYMWTSRSNIVFSRSLNSCWTSMYRRFKCVLIRLEENFPGMNWSADDFTNKKFSFGRASLGVVQTQNFTKSRTRRGGGWSNYRHFYLLSLKIIFVALRFTPELAT